jgi:hypothetical protein
LHGVADYSDHRETQLVEEFHRSRRARRVKRREALAASENGCRVL